MDTGLICKIIALAAILGMSGCSSVETRQAFQAEGRPILSAEQARSMIQVTVTPLPPVENRNTIIAANPVE